MERPKKKERRFELASRTVQAQLLGRARPCVQAPRLVAGSSGEVKNWVIAAQNGQVPDLPESRWGEFKKVTGVLTATVPIDRRASFYAQWGDWLPWTCWAGVIGCWLIPVGFRRWSHSR